MRQSSDRDQQQREERPVEEPGHAYHCQVRRLRGWECITYYEESDAHGDGEVEVGDGEADQGPHSGVLVHEHLQQGGQTGETEERD